LKNPIHAKRLMVLIWKLEGFGCEKGFHETNLGGKGKWISFPYFFGV
jgi:hypothetical protein